MAGVRFTYRFDPSTQRWLRTDHAKPNEPDRIVSEEEALDSLENPIPLDDTPPKGQKKPKNHPIGPGKNITSSASRLPTFGGPGGQGSDEEDAADALGAPDDEGDEPSAGRGNSDEAGVSADAGEPIVWVGVAVLLGGLGYALFSRKKRRYHVGE